MIVEAILNLILLLLKTVFALLPNIPAMDIGLVNSLNGFVNIIFSNLSLLGIFIRIDTIKILVPLILIAVNFEQVYKFIMWVIKKLPIGVKD